MKILCHVLTAFMQSEALTYYKPMSHLDTRLKRQKAFDFLTFFRWYRNATLS